MKKLFSFSFIFIIIILVVFSCNKSIEEKIVYQYDTVHIKDTIQNYDTLFIYDTIIHTDTIVFIDTVIIQDTSEFAYLFQHYELETYDIIFHTINRQKEPYQICTMRSDGHDINYVDEGLGIYPIWSQDSASVEYVDLGLLAIVEHNLETNQKTVIWNIDRNIMYIWYSPILDIYLATYYEGEKSKVIAIDYKNDFVSTLSDQEAHEAQPSTSDVDDWIYFCREDQESWNIYRRKLDLSIEEEVYIDNNFNMTSFKVSSDGKFLVTPKFKGEKGFAVFYDIEKKEIIHELDLPVDGYPFYTTLSKDNKALFFVNGIRGDFTKPRNIYRIALDRTQLMKLTTFEEKLAFRPLVR